MCYSRGESREDAARREEEARRRRQEEQRRRQEAEKPMASDRTEADRDRELVRT